MEWKWEGRGHSPCVREWITPTQPVTKLSESSYSRTKWWEKVGKKWEYKSPFVDALMELLHAATASVKVVNAHWQLATCESLMTGEKRQLERGEKRRGLTGQHEGKDAQLPLRLRLCLLQWLPHWDRPKGKLLCWMCRWWHCPVLGVLCWGTFQMTTDGCKRCLQRERGEKEVRSKENLCTMKRRRREKRCQWQLRLSSAIVK